VKKENTIWKTKLIISLILISAVPALFLGSNTGKIIEHQSQSAQGVYTNVSDSFIIGAMDMGGTSGYEYYHPPFSSSVNYYDQYDSMNFNLWHKYTIKHEKLYRDQPHGWREVTKQDSLFADNTGNYIQGAQEVLDANEDHNLKTLMMRPKIEWLCFGQRSDYQCEFIPKDEGDFWYYAYDSSQTGRDTIDNSSYGNGAKVKYCKYNSSNPGEDSGYVVKNLRSNREQVNPIEAWQGDRQCPWLVKPRIRIDSNYVSNPSNLNKKVCRVDIYDYYGNINDSNKIKSVDIYVKNFIESGSYSGKYLEEYFFSPNQPASAIKIDTGIVFNRYGEDYFWTDKCKADFRVFWYGQCDMWIDYVRVDNDVASDLLSKDSSNQNYLLYNQWIQWEATDIAQHGTSPFKFYIEEFEYNNLPCIQYVNKKLMEYNPNMCLVANINYPLINAHLPYPEFPGFDNLKIRADYISRYIIDSCRLKELFITNYPFFGEKWRAGKIPNTLPSHSTLPDFDSLKGLLANYDSPSNYDNWLQGYLDEGDYYGTV